MEDLVREAMRGDRQAFASLAALQEQQLYKIASARLDDEQDACDAVQNAMLSAFRGIRKLKDPRYFKTWFVRILINECNRIYQKKKHEISCEEGWWENAADPTDRFSQVESELTFRSVLEILSYEERQVMILFYSCDFTTREISRMLSVNENTVKTKLSRAREKIKNIWKEEDPRHG